MVMRVLPLAGISAPRFALEKSYSAFIGVYFIAGGAPRRDQTNETAAQSVGDDQYCTGTAFADGDESLRVFGIRIRTVQSQRVQEDTFLIGKRHMMFVQIPRRLGRIELKVHGQMYAYRAYMSIAGRY